MSEPIRIVFIGLLLFFYFCCARDIAGAVPCFLIRLKTVAYEIMARSAC
jgi:hypothetical protein